MPYDDRSRWGDQVDEYKLFIVKAFLFLMFIAALSIALFLIFCLFSLASWIYGMVF